MIKIKVNGQEKQLPANISVAGFVTEHKLDPEVVVIELNEKIIKKKEWAAVQIKSEDKLEIVSFVGGG